MNYNMVIGNRLYQRMTMFTCELKQYYKVFLITEGNCLSNV